MQITINLSNKTLAILVGVLTFLAIGLVVYAYNNIPNPGHGADQIVVNIDGQEMTLQEAIDSGKFGFVVQTGSVQHGQQIPLPPGFTQDQCKWMVSPRRIYETGDRGYENDNWNYAPVICYADATTRVVTCKMEWCYGRSACGWVTTGSANYIVICRK